MNPTDPRCPPKSPSAVPPASEAGGPGFSATETERSRILRPFVQKLAELGATCEPHQPSRVTIGSHSFQVEPWERQVLVGALEPQAEEDVNWHVWVAEALAVRAKSLSDLERLAASGGREGVEALAADAALGCSLMIDLQRAVDRMVTSGELDRAKKLTQFRNKLGQSVAALEEHLGEARLAEAERRAVEYAAPGPPPTRQAPAPAKPLPPVPDGPEVESLLALEKKLARQQGMPGLDRNPVFPDIPGMLPPPELEYRRPGAVPAQTEPLEDPSREHRPRASQAKRLLLVLAALVVAWGVFVLRPALTRVEIPVLTIADLGQRPEIHEITARPPSLFVKVDTRLWNGLAEVERYELVEAIGARLAEAGYTGAHLTNLEGVTVGQWLKEKGVRLYDRTASGS